MLEASESTTLAEAGVRASEGRSYGVQNQRAAAALTPP